MIINKAVITAAGQGTRLSPASSYISKEMFPIISVPIIEYALNECLQVGVTEMCFVVKSNKDLLFRYISEKKETDARFKNVNVSFIVQGKGRGTAKAIENCQVFTQNEPFYVVFPDEICIKKNSLNKLNELFNLTKNSVVGCKRLKNKKEAKNYGMIEYIDKQSCQIKRIWEKPESNSLFDTALCGRFIFTDKIYMEIKEIDSFNGEYLLTDAITKLSAEESVLACDIGDILLDTGNPLNYTLSSLILLYNDSSESIKKQIEQIINKYIFGEL